MELIGMNPSTPAATSSPYCVDGLSRLAHFGRTHQLFGVGYLLFLQNKDLKLVGSAVPPRPTFSLDFGFHSQTFEAHDASKLCSMGPIPGDIAEAYCRIFGAAEHLHSTLMDTLCDPETGICTVPYDFSSEVLEDKIVAVLGWLMSVVNKGRQNVLLGSMEDVNKLDKKLLPLAAFRSEIKRCCESLHVVLENYLVPGQSKNVVWKRLQCLENLCYDLGFPRGEHSPAHMLIANQGQMEHFSNNSISSNRALPLGTNGAFLVNKLSNRVMEKYLEDEKFCLLDTAEYKSSKAMLESSSSVMDRKYDQGRKGTSLGNLIENDCKPLNELSKSRLKSSPSANVNPFRPQLPPSNVFSRKEMSGFLRNMKSPATAVVKHKGYVVIPSMKDKCSSPIMTNGNLDKDVSETVGVDKRNDAHSLVDSGESDSEVIEGDMCASVTGVVRLQSRRKAEMFLIHTDGFSCTREKVAESSLAFTHPSTQQQMLMWKSKPKTVLLLKKLGRELMDEAKEVASFLHDQEKMSVLVEPDVHDSFARIPGFGFVQTFYGQDSSNLHEKVDFVACLGGDGVILHASNLFQGPVPPVVSFNLGSLGFLTSHNFEDYKEDLRQVIHGNTIQDGVYITLRMRLRCEIFRNGKAMPGKVFNVLNEVVVDRGSNPYISKVECYEHDRLITKVQGDGIIVATPTGSTAYSTAAGGSMVHPNVPCMLFTPICPHSLSFRPVILPDSARLELKIPEDARSNAWVSFDGKRRQQLLRGDSVRISMSQHPLPTVNKSDQTGDWFHSLIGCLNWNERLEQKAL